MSQPTNESRSRGDSSRGDSSRGDSSRGDSSRGDSSRGDSSRGDSSRGDVSRIELTIPAGSEWVRVARLTVAGVASRLPFPVDAVEDIKLAVTEAINNAIQHAPLQLSRGDESETPTISIRIETSPDGLWVQRDRFGAFARRVADDLGSARGVVGRLARRRFGPDADSLADGRSRSAQRPLKRHFGAHVQARAAVARRTDRGAPSAHRAVGIFS